MRFLALAAAFVLFAKTALAEVDPIVIKVRHPSTMHLRPLGS